jgi:hypothetical protein
VLLKLIEKLRHLQHVPMSLTRKPGSDSRAFRVAVLIIIPERSRFSRGSFQQDN